MGRILLEMKLERTAIGAMAISTAAIDDVIGWVLLGVATALVTADFNTWHLLLQIAAHRRIFSGAAKNHRPMAAQTVAQKSCTVRRKKGCPIPFSRCCSWRCSRAVYHALSRHLCHLRRVFVRNVSASGTRHCQSVARPFFRRGARRVRPVFFTNTGLNTKIGGACDLPEAWLACALVLIAAVIGKLGGCYLGARLTGQPPREAGSIAR
jgi:hypothetical protein